MESRKITVVSTKTQSKKTFMSSAETLAELKTDLDNNGIDYTDMAFFEGTARVELKDDNSVLPHDVPYKGQVTNELVFMLTNASKKIKSGMDRSEAMSFIKIRNLQEGVKQRFGRNYTNVSTDNLISFINSIKDNGICDNNNASTCIEKGDDVVYRGNKQLNEDSCHCFGIKAAVEYLVTILYEYKYISSSDVKNINSKLKGNVDTSDDKIESKYSDSEIDDMFNFMF